MILTKRWENELPQKEWSKEVGNDRQIEVKTVEKSFDKFKETNVGHPKSVFDKPNKPRNKENENCKANLPSDVAF